MRRRPAEPSSLQRKVDSHDVRSFMSASIQSLVSAVDVTLSNLIARCWEGGGEGGARAVAGATDDSKCDQGNQGDEGDEGDKCDK